MAALVLAAHVATAASFTAVHGSAKCAFSATPTEKDLGGGFKSFVVRSAKKFSDVPSGFSFQLSVCTCCFNSQFNVCVL
jgi:hypothetical protein